MIKKGWLIISYFANIDAMAPSHHIDDRLPFFRRAGIGVRVVSSPCGERFKDFNHSRIPSVAPSGIRYEVRYFLRRKTNKRSWFKFWEFFLLLPVYPFYFLEKLFLRLDTTWSWFISATGVAAVLAMKDKPSIIYSTGGPVSAHLTALFVSRITKAPYIAEFQDPLVHQYAAPGKLERHFIKNIEKIIFRTADAVVFLTQQAMENAILRNNGRGKSFFVYAGAVPQGAPPEYKKGETLNISHFGSLGGSRNLDYFFRALESLFAEQPELTAHLRLNLFGSSNRMVQKQIAHFPYNGIVRVKGKVARHEALEHMRESDMLLLIQNTDDVSFETIPSKVYEYLLAGRPILALVYRNHELREMLEKTGHVVVRADDDSDIKKGLKKCIDLWNENKLTNHVPASPFTVGAAVEKLISLADNIRKTREGRRL